jgi:hypothetical protein
VEKLCQGALSQQLLTEGGRGSEEGWHPQEGCEEGEQGHERPCKCPTRTSPPEAPEDCPFAFEEKNIDRIKEWIGQKYASSSFNTCTNQKLPLVTSSPPLRLFVDKNVTPTAVHKPGTIPLHLQQQVKEELDRDVRIGVLEQVPVNTADTWCSRMVVCVKKSGKARRTVDFKAVNRAAPRQTHAVEPPFRQATSIPGNTWKTTVDAWNGYHSCPIHEEDRHVTTFLTPWGRYRYRTTPQGFLSAGDGYCQRYDLITRDVKNVKRCVDDSCLWEDTIEEQF